MDSEMTRRNQPEAALQRSVIQHLRWCAPPDVWFCHIPNGGARSPTARVECHDALQRAGARIETADNIDANAAIDRLGVPP